MKTKTELISYIRFQLSQLRAKDKHHEFEHLTRQFARLRICENILPATGPVSSGGDQGRDFETYRTFLKSNPIASSTFLGSADSKTIVFACSLQQENITSKIKSDISTICSGELPSPNIIYFFCEVDLPVAKRHKLQTWCKSEHNVEFEMFDGTGLSEQLSDIDFFWIAEQYLDVPSDFYSDINSFDKEKNKTYLEYKNNWLVNKRHPQTYADFFQIKYCLRKATHNNKFKSDLTHWIKKINNFTESGNHFDLKLRATYEICVASLRGLNNLTSKLDLLEFYFSHINDLKEVSHISDTTILLSYCSSAKINHHLDIEVEKLHVWSKAIIEKINNMVEKCERGGLKCQLLQIRGQASLLQFAKNKRPEYILQETLNWWNKLIDEVEYSPLFPLDAFANQLTSIIDFIGEEEEYIDLTLRVDVLLSQRSSGFVAAQKCLERAIKYYKSKKYLLAIKQLHRAKIDWFTAETLTESLMSMLLLSNCYSNIGLIYPAKYYALGASYLAHNHDSDETKLIVPKALFVLADCCYQGGEWLSFLQLSTLSLNAHIMYNEDPFDFDKHEEIKTLFIHAAISKCLTKRFDHDIFKTYNKIYSNWPLSEDDKKLINELSLSDGGDWKSISEADIRERFESQLSGRPYSDLGVARNISWNALGIKWSVKFSNNWLLTLISEGFVSILQIIIADIANIDLVLLPTSITLKTALTDKETIQVEQLPNNKLTQWKISFPRSWNSNSKQMEKLSEETLIITLMVLSKCSTLKINKLKIITEKVFSEGLANKVFSVRPYSELYQDFISEKEFNSIKRKSMKPLLPNFTFRVKESELLKWINSDGPGYSKEKATEFLSNRYNRTYNPIKLTLKKVLKNPRVKAQIRKLKKEGYLDWHIQTLIFNIALDYKVKKILPKNPSPILMQRTMNELMNMEETTDISVPTSIFNKENFNICKKTSIISIAKTWGLETGNSQTPDFIAYEKLLRHRYHNFDDDIKHVSLLNDI